MARRAHVFWAGLGIVPLLWTSLGAQPDPGPGMDTTRPCIAFISDTQEPIIFETLVLRKDRNAEATRILFENIVRVRPSSLFILGDLVSIGMYGRTWEAMDRHIDMVRRVPIPVHAILGNHELMFFPSYGEQNFQSRFPEHRRTGYVRTTDSVAVVLLNSNFGSLSATEQERQTRWYRDTLRAFDGNPAIRSVIVCCHHSPYSNSKIVGSSEPVQRTFVPPYLASRKSVLFLSGHAHTFEHFRRDGKDFLVIGGGGGLQQPLYTGIEQRWPDLSSPEKGTMFHFLLIQRSADTLTATFSGLREDFQSVHPRHVVRAVPAAAPATSP